MSAGLPAVAGTIGDTGNVFDQQVPAAKQGNQGELDDIGLAVDDLLDCGLEFFQLPGGGDH
jgi:hypothetical protein